MATLCPKFSKSSLISCNTCAAGRREISSYIIPGGTPLYKLYIRYVRHQRVWFLSHFGLKWGLDFDHFGPKYDKVCAL